MHMNRQQAKGVGSGCRLHRLGVQLRAHPQAPSATVGCRFCPGAGWSPGACVLPPYSCHMPLAPSSCLHTIAACRTDIQGSKAACSPAHSDRRPPRQQHPPHRPSPQAAHSPVLAGCVQSLGHEQAGDGHGSNDGHHPARHHLQQQAGVPALAALPQAHTSDGTHSGRGGPAAVGQNTQGCVKVCVTNNSVVF